MTTTTSNQTKYVTLKEIGSRLGISRATALRMCHDGTFRGAFQLPGGKRRGGDWRVPETVIQDLVNEQAAITAARMGEDL